MIGLTMLAPMALQQSDAIAHTFKFQVSEAVKSVSVAGTFNNWDKDANPLKPIPGNERLYTASLKLRPGKHTYKFVIDGKTWVLDPSEKAVTDGTGNTNSSFFLYPADYSEPAQPDDAKVTQSALAHLETLTYRNYDRGRMQLAFRARPNDLAKVSVRVNGRKMAMQEVASDELFATYKADFAWDRKKDVAYAFELVDGNKVFTYGPNGLSDGKKTAEFVVSAKSFVPFEVPAWVERSVLYQIFPDRFENGDRKNDPAGVEPWNAQPKYWNRFGGDVAGVRQHISYLKSLGVNCVYFNPIFSSPSNHRYDATDYLKVDPYFGTNEEFADLTKELRSKGIRTVLDGVFNHTATNFFAFNDVVSVGENSNYRDWYTIRSFPVAIKENPNYVAWYNFPSMPKLNLANPTTRNYMLNVPKFWNEKADIAGWRLDVANEVSPDYWRAFRKTVKGIGKDRWIVGEMWGDASPWLQGDQWDATMNYRFRDAVLSYVGKNGEGKPSVLLDKLMSAYHGYAPQVSRNLMNLVGSHDTPRVLSECGNDQDLAKLAATLQFTWIGAPSIYYGDELGMEGAQDPDNRRAMRWDLDSASNGMLTYYKRLISIRLGSKALQSGDPKRLLADDQNGTVAYARVLGKDVAITAMNRSDRTQSVTLPIKGLAPLKTIFTDALTERQFAVSKEGSLIVSLPPKGAAVLIPLNQAIFQKNAR